MQVRVVKELGEHGGDLLVLGRVGGSALLACLGVVGRRVEGDDAADVGHVALLDDRRHAGVGVVVDWLASLHQALLALVGPDAVGNFVLQEQRNGQGHVAA